ncbi:MAG TPA: hypothetical protein VEH30_09460 [Terriglobales bacterium]|nr:hypothetical protein [Terriglobales bacterium]
MQTSNTASPFTAAPVTPQLRTIVGERLPNGIVLDLVREPSGLMVIQFNGSQTVTGRTLVIDEVSYCPPILDPTIDAAIIFPCCATEYGNDARLLRRVADVYCKHAGLPWDLAVYTAVWILRTWVFELSPIRPTLCVRAENMAQALPVFRIFRVLCRRALSVAELKRELPFFLQLTMLVNDRKMPLRGSEFWTSANYVDTFILGPRGTIRQIACSRAVLLQTYDPLEAWAEDGNAMHMQLPPGKGCVPSDASLAALAEEFQPQLQMFRFRHLRPALDTNSAILQKLPDCELTRELLPCIPDDTEVIEALAPLLQSHQQDARDRRSREPRVAIVEVLWTPVHKPGEATATKIAKLLNALLRSRGEFRELNAHEVGRLLNRIGLVTHRGVLTFNADVRQRVHELAAQFHLELPAVEGCPICSKSVITQ